jgi:serine phosphatase RsbU (regulator of sigma subunit)
MPPALVLRATTGEVEEVPLKGMPLGSLVDYPYTESELSLHPGDTVLLMSDGFAERFNQAREHFGYDSAIEAFLQTKGRSPAGVIEHLVSVSDTWAGGTKSTDDITFLVMKAKDEIS